MTKRDVILVAGLVLAAHGFTSAGRTPWDEPASGAGRNPITGEPTSGAGRVLTAWPTIVDPQGPNSGAGRTPAGDLASGAGPSLLAQPSHS